jgi:hypothetical protein
MVTLKAFLSVKHKKYCLVWFLGFILVGIMLSTSVLADNESNFVLMTLPRGIQLQVPKGWWVLGPELRQLIQTTVEATMDLSDMDTSDRKTKNLIAVNSLPTSTYASVRVDSAIPPSMTQSEFSSLTPADIQEYKAIMRENLLKGLPLQGYKLLDMYGVRTERISGYPSVVVDYRRSGPKGPVIVQLNQILTPNQEIGFILSYRESEKPLWKPVIGKIRKSIVVKPWS